jgi:hypothetical protein
MNPKKMYAHLRDRLLAESWQKLVYLAIVLLGILLTGLVLMFSSENMLVELIGMAMFLISVWALGLMLWVLGFEGIKIDGGDDDGEF